MFMLFLNIVTFGLVLLISAILYGIIFMDRDIGRNGKSFTFVVLLFFSFAGALHEASSFTSQAVISYGYNGHFIRVNASLTEEIYISFALWGLILPAITVGMEMRTHKFDRRSKLVVLGVRQCIGLIFFSVAYWM